MEKLFAFQVGDDSYSVVRSVALLKLKNWVRSGWTDDNTRVPATAVSAIGELLRHSVRIGAHEDALHGLSALHEIGAQAVAERRTHISTTAMQEVASALSTFLAADGEDLRNYLVTRWAQDARVLSLLRLTEANVFFMRATEAIFPGITLWGKGVQELIAQLGPYDHISTHVVDPLAGWLDDALHDFGARQENQIHYFAVEGLAVLYCLALTQAHAVAAKKPARADEARNLTDVVLRWVAWLPGEEVGDVLLDPGTAEMVWSALVTLSFTADDPSLLGEAAEAILEKLGDRLGEAAPVHDTFSLEFVTGILVAAGCPEEEISSAWSHLQDERRWGGSYRGMYIDSLRPSAFVEPKPSSDRGSTLMGRDQSVGS